MSASPNPLLSACLPVGADDAVKFSAPWEAKAFAMVVQLSGAGHFTWAEWVECFSQEVKAAAALEAAGRPAPTYYEQWLAAAEKILVAKGLTSREQLVARSFAIGVAGTTNLIPA